MGNSACTNALRQAAANHLETSRQAKQTADQSRGSGRSGGDWRTVCRYQ